MSSFEVAVRLDGETEASSEVTGVVTVWTTAPSEPKVVRIQQLWRVHGRGNTDETVLEERTEPVPRLGPGISHEIPFRFRAPASPPSYHGRLLNVDHYVRARLDQPWGRDPKAEADYLVLPGAPGAEGGGPGPAGKASHGGTGCTKVIGWLLLPLILVLLVGLFVLLIPILLVIGMVMLVRRHLAERRLGRVQTEIWAPELPKGEPYSGPGAALVKRVRPKGNVVYLVRPGQTIPVVVRFTPPADVTLSGVRLEVKGEEVVTSGSGTDAKTYRETLWEEHVTMIEPATLMGRQPVETQVHVALPDTPAFSLDAPSNKVSWTATVRIDIPSWPDWVEEHALRMTPAR